MSEQASFTVREYEPGDEEAILDGFNHVFGRVDPGFVPRTLESWRWQFLDNPSGRRIFVGFDGDGRVVSQQAGIPVRVLHDGERVHWNQIVDSFSDPRYGKGLKRHRAFAEVSKRYCDHYGGPHPEDPVMYGLPMRAAWRMGHRFLGYEVCRSQTKLCLENGSLRSAGAGGIQVEEIERFDNEVDRLQARVEPAFQALTLRDAAHLNWRFVQRPGHDYRIALARRTGAGRELVGLAVFGTGVFDGEEQGLVCDWLVPEDEPAAGNALRSWLAEAARAADQERLTAVFPDTAPVWTTFQRAGFRVHGTAYFTSCGSYTARPPGNCGARWLFRHWYYTLGDFDQC